MGTKEPGLTGKEYPEEGITAEPRVAVSQM